MNDPLYLAGLALVAGHLGFDAEKRRLRDIPVFQYIIHWLYSAAEPLVLKLVDFMLGKQWFIGTRWGQKALKQIAATCRPLPHGLVVTTEAAQRMVDFIENSEGKRNGRFAIGPCLCQKFMGKFEGPLMKDIQFLYARDMFLSLRMGHRPASSAEVKTLLAECREHGYIHLLEMCMQSGKWAFCICNCEPRICAPTRIYLHTGHLLWPGPEIAKSEPADCLGINSCGKCREVCIFGAIEAISGKSRIDSGKCMGCGLCAFTCPAGALKMASRPDYRMDHLVPDEILKDCRLS